MGQILRVGQFNHVCVKFYMLATLICLGIQRANGSFVKSFKYRTLFFCPVEVRWFKLQVYV